MKKKRITVYSFKIEKNYYKILIVKRWFYVKKVVKLNFFYTVTGSYKFYLENFIYALTGKLGKM